MHRVFGYRGVILFPWRAKIYDRNTYVSSTDNIAPNAPDTDTTLARPSDETVSSNTGIKQNAQSTRPNDTTETDSTRSDGKKEVTVDVQNYYQVLIDSRDCPHVVMAIHSTNIFVQKCIFLNETFQYCLPESTNGSCYVLE